MQVRLEVGAPSKELVAANGPFFEETGGNWVFVLPKTGNVAERRTVRFGRRNPEQIEVLSGLAEGERIITSRLRAAAQVRSRRDQANGRITVISLKGVRKLYRADNVETAALANVSLQIDQGEFVAVMGPSGCGKSTLLNIVGMIDTPTGGEYRFCGENVAPYPESRLVEIRRKHLGFVFQSFNLIDDLTRVRERRVAAALSERAAQPAQGARARSTGARRICARARSTNPRSFPAVSSSASPLLARWCAIRS